MREAHAEEVLKNVGSSVQSVEDGNLSSSVVVSSGDAVGMASGGVTIKGSHSTAGLSGKELESLVEGLTPTLTLILNPNPNYHTNPNSCLNS
jgi:hypothetical protein